MATETYGPLNVAVNCAGVGMLEAVAVLVVLNSEYRDYYWHNSLSGNSQGIGFVSENCGRLCGIMGTHFTDITSDTIPQLTALRAYTVCYCFDKLNIMHQCNSWLV